MTDQAKDDAKGLDPNRPGWYNGVKIQCCCHANCLCERCINERKPIDPDDATIEEARKAWGCNCGVCRLCTLVDIATRRGERIKEDNAVCICGCPDESHELYDEGESCEDEAHQCLRVCVAVRDMWTRRGEERDEAKADAQEAYEAIDCSSRTGTCKDPANPCWKYITRTIESERDALAEENGRLKAEAMASPVDPAAWWKQSDENKRLRETLESMHPKPCTLCEADRCRIGRALSGGGE